MNIHNSSCDSSLANLSKAWSIFRTILLFTYNPPFTKKSLKIICGSQEPSSAAPIKTQIYIYELSEFSRTTPGYSLQLAQSGSWKPTPPFSCTFTSLTLLALRIIMVVLPPKIVLSSAFTWFLRANEVRSIASLYIYYIFRCKKMILRRHETVADGPVPT